MNKKNPDEQNRTRDMEMGNKLTDARVKGRNDGKKGKGLVKGHL